MNLYISILDDNKFDLAWKCFLNIFRIVAADCVFIVASITSPEWKQIVCSLSKRKLKVEENVKL